ncbi:MAG: hypothetical protein KIT31_00430 [Deltaproteobacteria bacterium]|nr:hypothetical protein [Deltaproteobacteria bacterium]
MKHAKLAALLVASFTASFTTLGACGGGGGKGPSGPSSPPPGKISAANAQFTTGEQVVEAALVALGGRDKLSKITSIKTTGSLSLAAMGMKGKLSSVSAPPRSSLTVIDLPGLGKIQQGTRGDVAWEMNPATGARVLKGEERTTSLREATFNSEINWKDLYQKADLGGVVDFQGIQAYKVTFTAKEGGDQITRYYAQDTLLPIGYEATVKSQMGEIAVQVFETDFREVDGIKFPHTIKRKDAMAIEITIDSIELSTPVDPSAFDLPAEIKALVK